LRPNSLSLLTGYAFLVIRFQNVGDPVTERAGALETFVTRSTKCGKRFFRTARTSFITKAQMGLEFEGRNCYRRLQNAVRRFVTGYEMRPRALFSAGPRDFDRALERLQDALLSTLSEPL